METTNDIYSNYHVMTGEISTGLDDMAKFCEDLKMTERAVALKEQKKRLQSHKFAVGILGEFKRGKSTVINALLGQEIMPADILPCSATMNRVSYDLKPSVQLNMMDGSKKSIEVNELSQYVTKLDGNSTANAAAIEEAIVFYPCGFCQNGVDIVDTPGLNDDDRMNKITEETIPKLDAVIMVLVPDNPFSMSEAEFVRTKLMCSDIGRLIFLVNKIDTVRAKDRARVVEGIRDKIEQSVLEKTAEIYGEDSEQYKAAKQKLVDIRIYPISAQNALDGRVGDGGDASENAKLVEDSGVPEFEKMLGKMLTEERGFLELGSPLAQVLRSATEAKEKVDTYIDALDVDEELFQKAERELLAKQNQIKKDEEDKISELKKKSREVKQEMTARAETIYNEAESEAYNIIENMTLQDPKANLTDEIKQSMISDTMRQINEVTSNKISILCERVGSDIESIVGSEAQEVMKFLTHSQHDLIKVQKIFNNNPNNKKITSVVDGAGIALDMVTSLSGVAGLNGVISGYQEAGVKGALVGGAAGLAANLAVWNLVLVPLAAPLMPALLISATAGTVASKLISKKVFKKSKNLKELNKMKEELKKNVGENFIQLREDRKIESWIESTVSNQFDSLCTTMENECDAAIREAENTINQIKLDLTRNAAEKEAAKKNYLAISESIDQLTKKLDPIRQKLLQYSNIPDIDIKVTEKVTEA